MEVGYWTIRGLGAPLRMICEYSEKPYTSVNCDCTEVAGGGWDMSLWFGPKEALKAVNPRMNLPCVAASKSTREGGYDTSAAGTARLPPGGVVLLSSRSPHHKFTHHSRYLKDTDGTLIAQTNACLRYLGTKYALLGETPKEQVVVDELLCEAMDLRNAMFTVFYMGSKAGLEGLLSHASLAKLEASIGAGPFTLGAKPNVSDFHIAELVDQLLLIKAFGKYEAAFEYPKLRALRNALWAEPKLAKYFSSPLSKLPVNNKMACFGATPSGGDWVPGQSHDWGSVTNTV